MENKGQEKLYVKTALFAVLGIIVIAILITLAIVKASLNYLFIALFVLTQLQFFLRGFQIKSLINCIEIIGKDTDEYRK